MMNPPPIAGIAPAVSQEEESQQDGAKVSHCDLSGLPRSIRWRIQLGLLKDPTVLVVTDYATSGEASTAAPLDVISVNENCTLDDVTQFNREIIAKQNERFRHLVEKHVEEDEGEVETSKNVDNDIPQSKQTPEIDPLTAMVMEEQARETRKAELYLKYRKERARRKRGLTTEARIIESESDEVDRASLVIIEKDLKRLPHPKETKQLAGSGTGHDNTPEQEARITSLREILYIYAQEHPGMGYRQGMHEIASFLLFVLELEHQEYSDHPLFNPILPVCFALLERTLEHLKTAYDASGGKSLQQMSVTILGKILQNDPTLYHHLTSNRNIPPPPIYCTRWVRLMFSREVVGYENVFRLWDVLFNYVNLAHALEIASAGRILLLRDLLLVPDNNTLDLLMNVPPLADITPLTDILQRLMNQKETDQAIQLPRATQNMLQQKTTDSAQDSPFDSTPQQQQHYPYSQHQEQQWFSNPPIPSPAKMGEVHHPLDQPFGDSKFSFSKMRQSLGQKGETLKQKIINTTTEWKEAAARRESSTGSFSVPGSLSSHSVDPLGGLIPHSQPLNGSNAATTSFGDSFLRQSSTPAKSEVATPVQPKTPKQHQHEMWSLLLQQKIWTVQEFLIALESRENQGTVPREVWEALADMDRMQRELLNYSRNMASGPY